MVKCDFVVEHLLQVGANAFHHDAELAQVFGVDYVVERWDEAVAFGQTKLLLEFVKFL